MSIPPALDAPDADDYPKRVSALLRFLVDLACVWAGAFVLGKAARRLGQPSVLGELLAGVVLGALPFFGRGHPALGWLAEAGVVLLLFETGLHCDIERLLKAGPVASAVAVLGVAVPFALGWGLMAALGKPGLECLFVGAALTATSVGITARVLTDLDALGRPESQIILGAAVIDDVLGILILTGLQSLVPGAGDGGHGEALKSALILGSFAAGVACSRSRRRAAIERVALPATRFLAPVFFVMVGAGVDLSVLSPAVPGGGETLALSAALIAVAIAGKLASALAVRGKGLNRWAVGCGMIPRGEVGLIFAQIGLTAGIVEPALYAAVVAMVVVTTFLAPPLLKKSLA